MFLFKLKYYFILLSKTCTFRAITTPTIIMIYTLSEQSKLIKLGDYNAFEAFFREYYKSMVFTSMRIVGSKDIAEEVVQDTFTKLWEKHDEIDITSSLKSYMYGAVRNNSLRVLRDNALHTKKINDFDWNSEDSGNQLQERFEEEIYTILECTLISLPSKTRQIFEMNRNEGKKYREIALELGISEKTVEVHISAALKLLRTNLSEFLSLLIFLWI